MSLHNGLYRVLYVPLSTGNPMDVYKSIAWELDLSSERSRAALYKQIRAEVSRLCTEARQHTLLILDKPRTGAPMSSRSCDWKQSTGNAG